MCVWIHLGSSQSFPPKSHGVAKFKSKASAKASKKPVCRSSRTSKPPAHIVHKYTLYMPKLIKHTKAKAVEGLFIGISAQPGNVSISFSPGFFQSAVSPSLLPLPGSLGTIMSSSCPVSPLRWTKGAFWSSPSSLSYSSSSSSGGRAHNTASKLMLSLYHTTYSMQVQGGFIPKWFVANVLVPIVQAYASKFYVEDVEALERAISIYPFPSPPCPHPLHSSSSPTVEPIVAHILSLEEPKVALSPLPVVEPKVAHSTSSSSSHEEPVVTPNLLLGEPRLALTHLSTVELKWPTFLPPLPPQRSMQWPSI